MPEPEPSMAVVMFQSDREQRFVEEYAVDGNGYRAAIRAGYGAENVRLIVAELLGRPDIQVAVNEYRAAHMAWVETQLHRTVAEMVNLAFSDVRDVVTWDGSGKATFVPSAGLSPEISRAIKTIKFKEKVTGTTTDRTIELQLHDKKGSLDSLMKHLGLFPSVGKAGSGQPASGPGLLGSEAKFDLSRLSNPDWEQLKHLLNLARVPEVDKPLTLNTEGD